MSNRITKLFGIQYPIIQGGMVWCSSAELVSAVSNAGGLGLLGAGSMYPDQLREEIKKVKASTTKPFGVNLPLTYPDTEQHIETIIKEKVPIVFTSAGNPKTWTPILKEKGIVVVHVVSSSKFALKAAEAGVDAIVAEGFEAGGHNGREETTTLCLLPSVCPVVSIPVIAAGGIASGAAMTACFALGAEGVQIGTAFALSEESNAHQAFKEHCVKLNEGDTKLLLKKLSPTRLAKGTFKDQVEEAEAKGASVEEMRALLGRGRSKKGILLGDLEEGELEIGQISATIQEIKPVKTIVEELITDFNKVCGHLSGLNF